MTIQRGFLVVLACLIIGLVLAPPSLGQGNVNRAGVVIQHGDGTVFSTCVEFDEPSITGLELLQRAGVSLSVDSSSGLGTLICALDDEGCNYPDDNCFCQCQGASCTYWIYWHLVSGEWHYSQLGAAAWKITDGSVDGWIWGTGDPSGGEKPPATSFNEICVAKPTPSPPATPTRVPGQTPELAVPSILVPATPAQPAKTPVPAAVPDKRPPRIDYLAFVAIVLALTVLVVRQLRRS